MSDIAKFHLLNADGTRGEKVDYNNEDNNQLLGVLLKTEVLEKVGLVGHFFVSKFQNKAAVLKIEHPNLAKTGALVLFSRQHYEHTQAKIFHKFLSFAEITFVDGSPFYNDFEVHNMFRCNLVNYQIKKIVQENKTYHKNPKPAWFIHPIFGKITFSPGKVELKEGQVHRFIGLESDIPTNGLKKMSRKEEEKEEKKQDNENGNKKKGKIADNAENNHQPNRQPSYGNMKFKAKVIPKVDEHGNIIRERNTEEWHAYQRSRWHAGGMKNAKNEETSLKGNMEDEAIAEVVEKTTSIAISDESEQLMDENNDE